MTDATTDATTGPAPRTRGDGPWTAGHEHTVPVPGGRLAATRWGDGPGTPVVAVHGITANGHSFARVAAELSGLGGPPLVAPDLRGRGLSGHLPGRGGLADHADDVIAVLDEHGVRRTVLVGHSMGAFVACLASVRHPERVAGLLLVDGGHGLPVPPGTDIDAVLGPALLRLRMTFANADDYRAFWGRHPAFAGRWNTWADHYVLRDLVGEPPRMRSACDEDAVRTDGAQVLADPDALGAVHRLPCPARLLWTARGLMDESPGLYTPERLAGLPGGVSTLGLPHDNHYSPLFSSTAALVAEQIHSLVQETVEVQGEL
ncbi:alpha/beta hydrolase [Nocardiopsis sp. CT-R113]|uniref:Alpha/beta hydrolase n=1 Tax=Nocardiopsis codii TaxID=3065942 RepID=A0ABU7KGH2_9ACTN|nr:alpha/beta hydrolase [Nocardiopsis sp. CT-R113]MEE2041310.1 alpha/beta hydrolase [Nocardiopsis sp. CT-R113]